jgi:hypothetical protein
MIGNRMLREGDHRDILSLFIGSVKTAQASSRALRTALYNQVMCCALTSCTGIDRSIAYSIQYTIR